MKSARWPLTVAFLAAALLLSAFLFTTLLAGDRISFLYSRVTGFSALRSITTWAGTAAGLGFLVSAGIIAVAMALQPGGWLRKAIAVVPALALLFMVAALAGNALGIGTVGNLAFVPVLGPVTFATAWLALAALLTLVAVTLMIATGRVAGPAARAAVTALGLTTLAGVVAALAMIVTVALVTTNQPSLPAFGAPNAGLAQGGAAGGSQATPNRGEGAFRQGGEGGEGGFRGGPEGGPGGAGGLAALRQQFVTAGTLMVVFALVLVFSLMAGMVRSRQAEAAAAVDRAPATGGSELVRAVLAGVGVAAVALGAIQLIPVQRANPPVHSTINWDSAQTAQLWQRACADCHSNQTQWPWYTTIAPGSWLTAAHVNSGRQRLNLSDLQTVEGVIRANEAARESAQQIRSGAMPPTDYTLIHPAARLSAAEKQALIQGMQKSLAQ